MSSEDLRTMDPTPRLRRRVRSAGIVGLVLALASALTAISDPPVGGADAVHPWVALLLTFVALTSAKRTRDAPFGTPGGHLLRAFLWLALAASTTWNMVQHAEADTLLLIVGIPTLLVALANAGIRGRLSRVAG